MSTDYVFDGEATSPYDEAAPTAPLSVYGRSKLAGEAAALRLRARAWWCAPAGCSAPAAPNFVATLVRLIDGGQRTLRVVDDQTGCPTYAPFLAAALWELAEAGAAGRRPLPQPRAGHLVRLRRASWCGSGTAAVEVEPVTTADFPRPARRPAYSVLAVDRFEALAGRRVEPWGLGLIEYLATMRRRRERER